MKFGKQLKRTVDDSLPDWRANFIGYKDLKRKINAQLPEVEVMSRESSGEFVRGDGPATFHRRDALQASLAAVSGALSHTADDDDDSFVLTATSRGSSANAANASNAAASSAAANDRAVSLVAATDDENESFMERLRGEVEKVNDFYIDKEEEYIIRYQFLASKVDELKRLSSAIDRNELMLLKRKLVDLHGELVLLENYSAVNYTGFRKILKKHDKKTGLDLQSTYFSAVLDTPFFLSKSLRKLITGTEHQLHTLGMFTKFRRGILAPQGAASSARAVDVREELAPLLERLRTASTASLLRRMDDIRPTRLGVDVVTARRLKSPTFFMLNSHDDNVVGFFAVPRGMVARMVTGAAESVFVRLLVGRVKLRQWRASRRVTECCELEGAWPSLRFGGGAAADGGEGDGECYLEWHTDGDVVDADGDAGRAEGGKAGAEAAAKAESEGDDGAQPALFLLVKNGGFDRFFPLFELPPDGEEGDVRLLEGGQMISTLPAL